MKRIISKFMMIFSILTYSISFQSFADSKIEYEKAVKLITEDKIEESVQLLQEISSSKDKEYSMKSNYLLGNYYVSKNNIVQAKKYYQLAIEDTKNTSNEAISALYQLSTLAYNENDKLLAEKYILEMDKRTGSKQANMKELLGMFYFAVIKNTEKAEENYNEAVKIDPNNLRYRINLLTLYEYKNDSLNISKTISNMKKINSKVSNKEIGIYYSNSSNMSLAKKYLEKAINEDKDLTAQFNLGIVYYNTGKKDEGIKMLQAAEKMEIKDATEILNKIK
ncbi:MAG: tetratricopeptide repeat protein [Leptotrichiaceae bacterium]